MLPRDPFLEDVILSPPGLEPSTHITPLDESRFRLPAKGSDDGITAAIQRSLASAPVPHRTTHPTGEQSWCHTCLRHDRLTPGLTRAPESAPQCLTCHRRRNPLSPESKRHAARARHRQQRWNLSIFKAHLALGALRHRFGRRSGFSRPVHLVAAGQVWIDQYSTLSRTRRRTALAVWRDLVVHASCEAGKRSRPGRVDAAGRLGVSPDTISRYWKLFEQAGLITREVQGGRVSHRHLVAGGATCVCSLRGNAKAAARRRVHRDGGQVCRWADRTEFRVHFPNDVAADDLSHERLVQARQQLRDYAGRLCPASNSRPRPVVPPPPVDDPAEAEIPNPTTVGGGGCIPPASYVPYRRLAPPKHRVRKPRARRRGRRLPAEAVTVAVALIDRARQRRSRLPQLAYAPIPMLASVLAARGYSAWEPRDVEALVADRVDAAMGRPPHTPRRPVAWFVAWLPRRSRDCEREAVVDQVVCGDPVARLQRPCFGANCSGSSRAVICDQTCESTCGGRHYARGAPGSCPECGDQAASGRLPDRVSREGRGSGPRSQHPVSLQLNVGRSRKPVAA